MSDAETREGRARVERICLQAWLAMGLKRPSGWTQAQWAEGAARLSGLLCRMSEGGLRALYLAVVEGCALRGSRHLPEPDQIQRVAAEIEDVGGWDSRTVRSYMASVAGRRALAMEADGEGLGEAALVELYACLKKHGAAGVHWSLIREEAGRRAGRVKRARRMLQDCPGDAWAEGVLRDHAAWVARAMPLVTGEGAACEG